MEDEPQPMSSTNISSSATNTHLARWILWNEAACCSPLPAVEGFPSIVLFWDINKEAEGVGFKQGMFHLWAAAAWDVRDPPATGVLLKTDLKIYRAHIQPICYRCEMRAILHCLISMKPCYRYSSTSLPLSKFLDYGISWALILFQTRECHPYFVWKLILQKKYPLNVTELPPRQLVGHFTDGLCCCAGQHFFKELTLLTQHTPASACRWAQHCMNAQLGISFLQSVGFSQRLMVITLNQTQKANTLFIADV